MADRFQDYVGYVCADWLNDVDWMLVEAAGKPRSAQQLRENIGACEEAPIDGGEYVRQDGGWVANSGGGGSISHNATTSRDAADCHPQSAITGLITALSEKIGEAPVDSQNYVRKDATWIVLPAGGGDPVEHNETNNRDIADCHPTSAITNLDTALAAKADVTYVDAGLATKADTTALDGYCEEAPQDGSVYGRQSGAWTQVNANGGGSGEVNIRANLIMNSGFHVNQRAANITGAPAVNGVYSVDRWRWKTSVDLTHAQLRIQSGSLNDNYSYHRNDALYYRQNSTDGTTLTSSLAVLEHPIEGHDFRDAFFGTLSAKTLTLSFTAVYSKSGTFTMSVGLQNKDRNRSFVSTVAVDSNKSRYTVEIPGETSGDWEVDNDIGAWLFFTFIAGSASQRSNISVWENNSNYAHTTQTNLTSALNDPQVFVSDIKLEIGVGATAYQIEPQAQELLRCQRYYFALTNTVIAASIPLLATATNTGQRRCYIRWDNMMRSTPETTFTVIASGGNFTSGMPQTANETPYGCVVQGDLDADTGTAKLMHLYADAEFTG